MGSPEGVGPCCLRSAFFWAFSSCLSWRARSFWRLVKEGRELAISAPFKDRISIMSNHTCFLYLTRWTNLRFICDALRNQQEMSVRCSSISAKPTLMGRRGSRHLEKNSILSCGWLTGKRAREALKTQHLVFPGLK